MKLLILIPCYNTHEYLNKLLSLLISQTNNHILLVDDGSSPSLNVDKFQNDNINIKRNDINRGKGYSIKLGFQYAIENNYTHVITLDGDMQHDPGDISKFINSDRNSDFVIGYRKFAKPMPYSRILSNSITSGIISTLIHKKINDSQCGYRRYKLSAINGYRFEENGSEFEQPLAIARDIKKLYDKLLLSKNSLTIDQFLIDNSDLRHVVRRAFIIEKFPYSEIQDNTISKNIELLIFY